MLGEHGMLGQDSQRMVSGLKYLTFHLGSEEFAVPVSKIKEIIGWQEITPIPQTPAYLRGVINLRGKVVPVVDLRMRLGMEVAEYHSRTCIVVAQTEYADGGFPVGVIVDGVSEVVQITATEVEPIDTFGNGLISGDHIHGVAKSKDKVRILLDLDRVLQPQHYADVGIPRPLRAA